MSVQMFAGVPGDEEEGALTYPIGRETPEQMLDELAALQDQLLIHQKEYDQIPFDLIPTELRINVKLAQDEIERRDLTPLRSQIQVLDKLAREACVSHKSSIAGRFLRAIFSAGRDGWDTKALMLIAKEHPEIPIMACYKPGEPYCLRIERVKPKKQ